MADKKPYILLSNDDGIYAPGLAALHAEISKIAEVVVVAPDSERSAVGHAITLSDPLRVWDYKRNDEFFGYAVSGTPADCVKIAYWALLDRKPDMVISGVNRGSNAGINAIYSGTVSAATEGTILNLPSFAVSLTTYIDPDFRYAAKFAAKLAQHVLTHGLPKGTLLNVNVPPLPEEEIAGVMVARQGLSQFKEHFDKRVDPNKRIYYWLTGEKVELDQGSDNDDFAIKNKYVSVTPLQYDLTNHPFLPELKSWNIEK